MNPTDQMPVGEQFKLLLEALKGYQSSFLDSGYKTLGFMVVALSWLVTSEPARHFLGEHRPVRWSALVFLLVLAISYPFMARRMYRLSASIFEKLNRLQYSEPDVYQHYAIKRDLWKIYAAYHVLISILIATVVWES